jgi:hypothetical protein
MSKIELRSQVHHLIDDIDDSFLKVIYSMLETYVQEKENSIIGYDIAGKPISVKDAGVEYSKRNNNMKSGNFITLEELKREVSEW